MTEKYNPNRDFFRSRMRGTSSASHDWEALQAVVGFAFTIQQEVQKLRRETSAMLDTLAQQQSASVKAGCPAALQRIVASAHNLTEASGAAIAIGNEQAMACVARSGACSPPLGSSFDPRFGLAGECVRTRESVICMNAAADPRVDYNACVALGIRSMVYRPLLAHGKLIGVLAVFSSRSQHFSHRDVNCLRWADELVAEALNIGPNAQLGVGALIRDVVLTEPEPALALLNAPRPPASSEAPRPSASIQIVPARSLQKPAAASLPVVIDRHQQKKAEPIFVGRIVDEAVADDEPSLTFGGKQPEAYDSPVPILVATIMVMAFLVAVGLASYFELTPKVKTPSAPPRQQVLVPAQKPSEENVPPINEPIATPETAAPAREAGLEPASPSLPSAMEFHSGTAKSIVTIKFDKPIKYQGFAIANPDRLYFDLHGVSLVGPKGTTVAVQDALVSRIRISLHDANVTRIVFDLRRAADFRAQETANPPGLRIELQPKSASQPTNSDPGLTIVIDPGHGGHDNGAISASGLREKDVTLDLAQRLGLLLEKRLGAKVVYTRTTDDFVPLPTRVAIANDAHADFLISIHGNSSTYHSVRGVETYYFQNSQDALARATDNPQDIAQDDVDPEAARSFAADVHRALLHGLSDETQSAHNRGLKTAQFVVLRDARMPAVLAEVAFMSSRKDAQRLESSAYRDRVAKALFHGIQSHVARRDARILSAINFHRGATVATR